MFRKDKEGIISGVNTRVKAIKTRVIERKC
jgi:hypothetical protein